MNPGKSTGTEFTVVMYVRWSEVVLGWGDVVWCTLLYTTGLGRWPTIPSKERPVEETRYVRERSSPPQHGPRAQIQTKTSTCTPCMWTREAHTCTCVEGRRRGLIPAPLRNNSGSFGVERSRGIFARGRTSSDSTYDATLWIAIIIPLLVLCLIVDYHLPSYFKLHTLQL